jgi:hypothetical protein
MTDRQFDWLSFVVEATQTADGRPFEHEDNFIDLGVPAPDADEKELDEEIDPEAPMSPPAVSDEPYPGAGPCPICGEPTIAREKQRGGLDSCKNGHKYPPQPVQPVVMDECTSVSGGAISSPAGDNTNLSSFFGSSTYQREVVDKRKPVKHGFWHNAGK